jgi:hypothetical protein
LQRALQLKSDSWKDTEDEQRRTERDLDNRRAAREKDAANHRARKRAKRDHDAGAV